MGEAVAPALPDRDGRRPLPLGNCISPPSLLSSPNPQGWSKSLLPPLLSGPRRREGAQLSRGRQLAAGIEGEGGERRGAPADRPRQWLCLAAPVTKPGHPEPPARVTRSALSVLRGHKESESYGMFPSWQAELPQVAAGQAERPAPRGGAQPRTRR